MYRPLSGSSVLVLPRFTLKWGDRTVGDQGRVMQGLAKHFCLLAPKVYACWPTGYVCQTMQRLQPYEWRWQTAADRLSSLWNTKEIEIYGRQEPYRHWKLLEFLWRNKSPLLDIADKRPFATKYLWPYESAKEATHGDATAENTVVNSLGFYSLIDWQWFRRPFVPAHRDVDYGKFLQSILGWHTPGYRGPHVIQQAEQLLHVSPNAWFWAGVHFERIRLRAKEDSQKDWCREQVAFCIAIGKHTWKG